MVTPSSTVELHPLSIHREGTGWIVGRKDTGAFVEMAGEAVTFIEALQEGEPISSAAERVYQRHDQVIDSLDFIDTLVELTFVAGVDGSACNAAEAIPSLRWLRPGHVRWLFTGPTYVFVGAFIVTGLVLTLVHGGALPSYRDFFVTRWQGINVALCTAMFVAAVALHEVAHLAAARSAGVHAKISLGTRLNFLCAQTTVTGLWGERRRIRFRVYFAGIATDLLVISCCLCAVNFAGLSEFAARLLRALILLLTLSIANQFALYMRTDMYCVLQEALRCKNLHADAWSYIRYRIHSASQLVAGRPRGELVPPAIPQLEFKAVKFYSWVMLGGTLVSFFILLVYGAPLTVNLLFRAAEEVFRAQGSDRSLRITDGAALLIVEGGLQIAFLRTFLKSHRPWRALIHIGRRHLNP